MSTTFPPIPPAPSPLKINCPKCGAKHVDAHVTTLKESLDLVIRQTTTWVTCSNCGTKLFSKRPAEELFDKTPEELEGVIVARVSLIVRAITILAIVLFWFPFLGFPLAIVATLLNVRRRGWMRVVSVVALVLSTLVVIFFLFVIYSGNTRK